MPTAPFSKLNRLFVAIALMAGSLGAASGAIAAPVITGRVVKVADGDTITIMTPAGKERIRFLGIDAPEKAQTPWGPRARQFLSDLVMGKDVRVEQDVELRDRYGRVLGYVYIGNRFANLELVKAGLSMLYTSPPQRGPHRRISARPDGSQGSRKRHLVPRRRSHRVALRVPAPRQEAAQAHRPGRSSAREMRRQV